MWGSVEVWHTTNYCIAGNGASNGPFGSKGLSQTNLAL